MIDDMVLFSHSHTQIEKRDIERVEEEREGDAETVISRQKRHQTGSSRMSRERRKEQNAQVVSFRMADHRYKEQIPEDGL